MDQRSAAVAETDERPFMLGIRWMSFGGRSGWFHTWSDGTVLPCLSGRDDDDDSGGDDTGGDDNDDDTGDDDDDDDDDDDSGDDDDDDDDTKGFSAAAKKRIKELSDENAKHRVKAKTRTQERDEARTKLAEVTAERDKLKKDGGSDETLKARNSELEEQVKTLTKKVEDLEGAATKAKVRDQVSAAMKKLKVDEDLGFVMYTLTEDNKLKVDDDGDVEDLESIIRGYLKSKTFGKVASGDGGDGSDGSGADTSGARRTRSKSSKRKPSGQGLDRATLEAKYPALRR